MHLYRLRVKIELQEPFKMVVIRVEEKDARELKLYGRTYADAVKALLDFKRENGVNYDKIRTIMEDMIQNKSE